MMLLSDQSAEMQKRLFQLELKSTDVAIEFDEIGPYLNGYARQIKYTVSSGEPLYSAAENTRLLEMTEGNFLNGLKDGYHRRFQMDTGYIFLGWFTKDHVDGIGLQFVNQ